MHSPVHIGDIMDVLMIPFFRKIKRKKNRHILFKLIFRLDIYFLPGVVRPLWYVFFWRKGLKNLSWFWGFLGLFFHRISSASIFSVNRAYFQHISNCSISLLMSNKRLCVQQTGLSPCLSEQSYILCRKNQSVLLEDAISYSLKKSFADLQAVWFLHWEDNIAAQ